MRFFQELKMLSIAAVFIVLSTALAGYAMQDDDVARFPVCKHCNMNRKQYASSRMLLGYADGTVSAFCSIHCLAIDLVLNIDKTPKFIRVADLNTSALIDAESASWVIGGDKKGVMTERAKWAFKSRKDAEAFVRQNGGEIASFEQALEAAYQDMYWDSKVIRNKRKIKLMIEGLDTRSRKKTK